MTVPKHKTDTLNSTTKHIIVANACCSGDCPKFKQCGRAYINQKADMCTIEDYAHFGSCTIEVNKNNHSVMYETE